MAKALETFKANAFDRLAMQESSAIVTSALKFTKANVMIADTDHTITFMNRAMREMFKNAEQDLRRDLPNFSVDSLIGVSMDDFHKDEPLRISRGSCSTLFLSFQPETKRFAQRR